MTSSSEGGPPSHPGTRWALRAAPTLIFLAVCGLGQTSREGHPSVPRRGSMQSSKGTGVPSKSHLGGP